LLTSFIKIMKNEDYSTFPKATSQLFYVIDGCGSSLLKNETIEWSKGDLFVVPYINLPMIHHANETSILLCVTDEPLLNYLGVIPHQQKFEFTFFKKEAMFNALNNIRIENEEKNLNRLGILLGNKETEKTTKTITHVLWSLLNVLPAHTVQKPHRHNSVALDFCIYANPEKKNVYTLVGKSLDENGNIINPIRCDWESGSIFITPPGLWHSHHNDTDEDAYVLPIQDAGLHTYLRTLDIRFS